MGVVRRHPRQAYDESNFGVDRAGAAIPAFSFDRGMLAAAEIRRGAPARAAQLALLSEVIPASVTIAQLAEGSTRPARSYLQQRLDVRLPHRVEEVETDIPLVVGGLESWQLANELLDHYRRGGDEDALRQWRDAKRRSGILPPRALADAALDEVERELGVLLKAPPNLRELLTVNGSVDVDIRIQPPNPDAPAVRLSEVIEHVAEDLLVRVVFSRPKSRHAIAVALELAALVVAEPARAWRALYVTRGKSGPGSATELQPIEGHDRGPAARRFLETVLAIHLRALREPIPMFEKSSRALYDTANFEDEEFESDLQDNHTGFLWGDSTPDEILAIPLRTDELKAVATIAATTACTGGGRAHAFARFLWTAYDEFIAHPVAAALERSAK